MNRPTHIDPEGNLTMVDVSSKVATTRVARARARVRMRDSTGDALRAATLPKGDAFVAAQIAAILAAKQTSQLIPLTHALPLSVVEVHFTWPAADVLEIEATAKTSAQTGVEMEAMVAASVAALTIYDMTKGIERGIVIESVRLVYKSGGKSGEWNAP